MRNNQNRIEKKEKKEEIEWEGSSRPRLGQWIISSLVAVLVTAYFIYKRHFTSLNNFDTSGMKPEWIIDVAVLLFSFGFTFSLQHIKKIKKWFSINIRTKFILFSLILSGAVNYGANFSTLGERMLGFSISFGICYALFTIFLRFSYDAIWKNTFQLIKSLSRFVLFPSLFLIVALMGKIDSDGTFLDTAGKSLRVASDAGYSTAFSIVETVYNLGKYKYSGLFMIAILVSLLFFGLHNFFKKVESIKK